MTWADTTAVRSLIQSVPLVATSVYVTIAPKPVAPATSLPLPYVIVHPKDGRPEQGRYTGPRSVERPEFTLHVVSNNANQVQVLLDLIKAKFVTNGFAYPPAVAGRRNYSAYWQVPVAIQVDNDATPPLVFGVAELGWSSEPA